MWCYTLSKRTLECFQLYIIGFVAVLFMVSCKQMPDAKFHQVAPRYKPISLNITTDTLHFPLTEDSYNSVRSFDYFIDKGREFIAFYDKQSISINIYKFDNQQLLRRISLKTVLPGKNLEKHTTVFVKTMDSIFVINKLSLFLFDSTLSIKDSVDLLSNPIIAFSSFENSAPPVFLHNKIYTLANPYLSTRKKNEYKKWKNIYQLDFNNNKARLLYDLPEVYQKKLLGVYYFNMSYCVNDKGFIVFSFPADSNIYETDLEGYHAAYCARSINQKEDVKSVTPKDLEENDGFKKAYMLSNSYGSIYFDPYHKRYLRIAEQKTTERDYMLGKKGKDRSVVFLDENFTIIGETPLNNDISVSTIFFTKNGNMYTRINGADESALHFVRVEYKEEPAKFKLATH